MKRFLCVLAALLVLVTTALPAVADGEKPVFSDSFDDVVGGLPAGWSFHSYEAEYLDNYANASASVVEEEGRGSVVHITVNEDDDAALYREVAVEPSSFYRISCMVKTRGVENGNGANVALREIVAASDGVYGDSDWTRVELVGRTGPVQDYLVVSCRLGGYGMVSHGEAWFDDFTVEKLESADGNIVPFFDGSTQDDDGEAKAVNGGAAVPIIIILGALAVAAGVFFAVRGKRGKTEQNDGSKPLPSVESYTRDASRGLSGMDAIRGRSFFRVKGMGLPEKVDGKLRFSKLDWIFVVALTAVYAAVSLIRLGTLRFPTEAWSGNTGDSVRIEFGRSVKISEVWQNSGISYINYVLVTDTGEEIAMDQKNRTEYGNMFRWAKLSPGSVSGAQATTGLTLKVIGGDSGRRGDPDLVMNELVIFDENGEKLEVSVPESAAALFDEQDTVPAYASCYNGMYFDELYHGRTALEHINNQSVYEWTHPPLGKLFIALGILVFGMKPFGWRIAGALFAIAMVPIMYCFGKRLLKRSELALFSTFLFTFDFMHFTMARIATVDTFAVFFILLMTYFMYRFIEYDMADPTGPALKALALSGVFFGLGCASKWICMYTGAALAVLFFVKLIVMGVRSFRLDKTAEHKGLKSKFLRRAVLYCCWCVIFFVAVPAVIYAASYCRYYTAQWKPAKQQEIYAASPDAYESVSDVKLSLGTAAETYVKGVIKNQKDMFNYHSGLKSDHSAASSWWMWLGNLRPTWFYAGGYGNPHGFVGTISAFGNPATWVGCTAATLVLAFVLLFRRRRLPLEAWFIFVCLGSSFLPWVLVPRSTYAYHFYASVPFICLAAGHLIGYWEDVNAYKKAEAGQKPGFVPKLKYVWMGLALLFFIIFYPVISGMEVPRWYVAALQWVPFHKWQIQNEAGEVLKTYRIGWRFLDYEPSNPSTTIIIK